MANSSSRYGATVIWVVIHTAEGATRASDLAAYFDRSTDSSCHAIADDTTLLDNLVPYDRAAWTILNGNSRSDNLELCGFASWPRTEWLNHDGMLTNAAHWIRSRCQARGIPIRKLDPAAVGRGESGVIGHWDYTRGTGDGTHWDPGPNFPWDVVIARAQGDNDMQLSDKIRLWDGREITYEGWLKDMYNEYLVPKQSGVVENGKRSDFHATAAQYAVNGDMYGYFLSKRITAMESTLAAIAAKVGVTPTPH